MSEPPRFDVTVTEGQRCRRTLAVKAPAAVVRQQKIRAAQKVASRVKLKGFRAGKASLRVVEQRFGPEIEREVVDGMVKQVVLDAFSDHGMRPASPVGVDKVRDEPDGGMSFEVMFDVAPTVVVQRLGGFRVERPEPPAADVLVDRFLKERQAERAEWTPRDGAPEPGDAVTVEIAQAEQDGAADEDEPPRRYDFVLGSGRALPAIDEAVRTLEPGANGQFMVDFPADHPDEVLRGKRNELRIALVERRIPVLPALDDAFAQADGECETLDEWKAALREQLADAAEKEANQMVYRELVRLVVEANDFEVPDSLVEARANDLIANVPDLDPEVRRDLVQRIWPEAEFHLKRQLVLDHIADAHGLRAGRAEVDAYMEKLAGEPDEPAAKTKTKADLGDSRAMEFVARILTSRKVCKFLEEQSEITRAA